MLKKEKKWGRDEPILTDFTKRSDKTDVDGGRKEKKVRFDFLGTLQIEKNKGCQA